LHNAALVYAAVDLQRLHLMNGLQRLPTAFEAALETTVVASLIFCGRVGIRRLVTNDLMSTESN
jgi:hypothetical protein